MLRFAFVKRESHVNNSLVVVTCYEAPNAV
jgi:hypothetical protein